MFGIKGRLNPLLIKAIVVAISIYITIKQLFDNDWLRRKDYVPKEHKFGRFVHRPHKLFINSLLGRGVIPNGGILDLQVKPLLGELLQCAGEIEAH